MLPAADLEHVLTHTRPLWERLRGQRLFVTGGTGFFGKWLLGTFAHANRVLGLGAEAVVLSRQVRPAQDAIRFVIGDVRTFQFPRGEFSHVIHAATTSSAPVEPEEMLETIVGGTHRTLDFAKQCGARKLLFTSSGAVYGPQPSDLRHVPETFACSPETPYGKGKAEAERLCLESGLDVKLARCFAFAGPHLPIDAHFAIGNFVRDALAGGPIKVSGDGSPLRSYLDAADLACCLWTLLLADAPSCTYNVGSDRDLSIAQLAHKVAAIAGGVSVEIAQPLSSRPPARYVPDISRARQELGLAVRVSLDEAIRKMLDWHTHRP